VHLQHAGCADLAELVDDGDGTVTYTPAAGSLGTDGFTYRVTGPDDVEREATEAVTVTEDEPGIPLVEHGAAAFVVLLGSLGLRRRKARPTT
jgi:hypothetical protein